jgi:integrase
MNYNSAEILTPVQLCELLNYVLGLSIYERDRRPPARIEIFAVKTWDVKNQVRINYWCEAILRFDGIQVPRPEERIGTLVRFFGNVQLEKVANPDLIRAFQVERSKRCVPSVVNRECSIIQQLLKRIRRWNDVRPFYEPLPLSRESPGRALTPDEERKLFGVVVVNPNWATAHWLALISAHTAAGPGELLGLRMRDVFVDNPETARIYIHENAKNKHRVREVPLNIDALAAAKALLELAKSRGAGQPDHYLVRIGKGTYDPTRHGNWPKTAWMEMCAAAGIKLRPYDLRLHGLTKLAENNPEQVVLKIAGHVSPQMLRKIYSHVRLPALRAAVDSIGSVGRARPTKDSKKTGSGETPEQTLFRVVHMAEQLDIPTEKAVQLLIEYERQQATRTQVKKK